MCLRRRAATFFPPSGGANWLGSLLDDLNEQQREAVIHGEGPLLVLAGAGSGKTRVLTYRIAHLLASGAADSAEITAVTFTNKAAREMRERVERLLGRPLCGGFVGTFHRWALEILRRWPRAAGLANALRHRRHGRPAGDDAAGAQGARARSQENSHRGWCCRGSLGWSTAAPSASAFVDRATELVGRNARPRLGALREAQDRGGVVDFDDMLVRALRAVREDAKVRDAVARRARFLLVDEFQDTNCLQMDLLTMVLDGRGNITAVGDEDQSIYRWRGAELDNILSFEALFPGARVVALEENYRSTAPILDGCRRSHRRQSSDVAARTSSPAARAASRCGSTSPIDERARGALGRRPHRELASAMHRSDEMAVLMRTNAQTRPFEEELTRRRVPYRVVGGLRFWQRAEIKDALAYLRLAVRPDDLLSFERVVNVPTRGIGAATIDVLRRAARNLGLSLPEAARSLPEGLSPRARLSLERFFSILDEAAEQRDELTPATSSVGCSRRPGLFAMYDGDAEDRVARRENLQQLAAAVAEAAARGQELEDFLDSVALLEENDDGDAAGGESPDDPALGQGARVRRRLSGRARGRAAAARQLAGRARGSRRGAASGLCRDDPGPRSGSP